jgi:hypothetical protein
MSGILNMWSLEGDLERKDTSTHVVSLCYKTKAVHVFFDHQSEANAFAVKWSSAPECAFMVSIEDYQKVRTICEKSFQGE